MRRRFREPGRHGPFRHRTRGQALVELAIVLPVLLVVVGAAIDLGRLFHAYVSIQNAAKEGAFYGSQNPRCDVVKTGCANPGTVDWHIRTELPGVSIQAPSIMCLDSATTVSKGVEACAEDDLYRVTVSHQFALVTPLLSPIFGSQFPLTSSATAVVLNEAFDPNATPFPMPTIGPTPAPTPTPTAPLAGCTAAPAANFTFSVQNKRVNFTDTSTAAAGCPITSWSWQFGDTKAEATQNPSHQYPDKDTTYQVTLTVTNAAGQNSLTKSVTTQ